MQNLQLRIIAFCKAGKKVRQMIPNFFIHESIVLLKVFMNAKAFVIATKVIHTYGGTGKKASKALLTFLSLPQKSYPRLWRDRQKRLDKSTLLPALINFGICLSKRVNFFDENSQNLSSRLRRLADLSGLRSVSPVARLGGQGQYKEEDGYIWISKALQEIEGRFGNGLSNEFEI